MKNERLQIEDSFYVFLDDDYFFAQVTKIETEITTTNHSSQEINTYYLSYLKDGVEQVYSTSNLSDLYEISNTIFLDINKISSLKRNSNPLLNKRFISLPL